MPSGVAIAIASLETQQIVATIGGVKVVDTATPVSIYTDSARTQLATVYTSATMTTPLAQPLTPDANGSVPGYVAPWGTYYWRAGTLTGQFEAVQAIPGLAHVFINPAGGISVGSDTDLAAGNAAMVAPSWDRGGHEWNADGFGAGRSSTEILAAHAKAQLAGGGQVYMGPGTWDIHDRIVPSSSVYHCGAGSSTVLRLHDTMPGFSGGGIIEATNKNDIWLRDFDIDGNKAGQSVQIFGVVLTTCTNSGGSKIHIYNTTYIGLFPVGSDANKESYRFYQVHCIGCGKAGVPGVAVAPSAHWGAIQPQVCYDSVFEDCRAEGSLNHNFFISAGENVNLARPKTFSAGRRGIYALTRRLTITDPQVEGSGWAGMELDGFDASDGRGKIGQHRLYRGHSYFNGQATAPWAEGSGCVVSQADDSVVDGTHFKGNGTGAATATPSPGTSEDEGLGINTSARVKVRNIVSEFNGGPGLIVFASTDTDIDGATLRGNGQSATTGAPYGYVVVHNAAGPVLSLRSRARRIFAFDDQLVKTQQYGAVIKAGGSDYNSIDDSDLTGNAVGGYSDASGAAHNTVTNTRGYP